MIDWEAGCERTTLLGSEVKVSNGAVPATQTAHSAMQCITMQQLVPSSPDAGGWDRASRAAAVAGTHSCITLLSQISEENSSADLSLERAPSIF